MWSDVWNVSYIELRILKSSELWSSQLWTQFKRQRSNVSSTSTTAHFSASQMPDLFSRVSPSFRLWDRPLVCASLVANPGIGVLPVRICGLMFLLTPARIPNDFLWMSLYIRTLSWMLLTMATSYRFFKFLRPSQLETIVRLWSSLFSSKVPSTISLSMVASLKLLLSSILCPYRFKNPAKSVKF